MRRASKQEKCHPPSLQATDLTGGAENKRSVEKTQSTRKRKLRMAVRIVPPGTLQPNLRNVHAKETAQQRREVMLRTVVRGLAAADRKRAGPLLPESSSDAEPRP
jgi:hypothetical protein